MVILTSLPKLAPLDSSGVSADLLFRT